MGGGGKADHDQRLLEGEGTIERGGPRPGCLEASSRQHPPRKKLEHMRMKKKDHGK